MVAGVLDEAVDLEGIDLLALFSGQKRGGKRYVICYDLLHKVECNDD